MDAGVSYRTDVRKNADIMVDTSTARPHCEAHSDEAIYF